MLPPDRLTASLDSPLALQAKSFVGDDKSVLSASQWQPDGLGLPQTRTLTLGHDHDKK